MTSCLHELADRVRRDIERIGAGDIEGSHLVGVYGIDAQRFESCMKRCLQQVLAQNGLTYDEHVRPHLNRSPPFDKLTLGSVWECLRRVRGQAPAIWLTDKFMDDVRRVNEIWVNKVKHGDELAKEEAVEGLQAMLRCLTPPPL